MSETGVVSVQWRACRTAALTASAARARVRIVIGFMVGDRSQGSSGLMRKDSQRKGTLLHLYLHFSYGTLEG